MPDTAPRYRLAVFDFDGTLADTREAALRTFNELAARFRFLPVTDPEAARGMSTLAFLRRQRVPLWRLPGIARAFLTAQRASGDIPALFPEIPGVLADLRDSGVRLGVVSSNTADIITACLRAHRVAGLFDFVQGSSRLFGKGRALRGVLRAGRVPATAAAYVGDEARDVDAARHARMDVAAVTWGFHAPAVLSARRPTWLVSRPADLVSLLRDGR